MNNSDIEHEIITYIASGEGETLYIFNYPEPLKLQKREVVKFTLRYKEHSKIITREIQNHQIKP